MHSQFVRWTAGAAVALSLLSAAGVAQAQESSGLTSTQIAAIVSLLQSFGADPSVITNVQATLNGKATTGTNTSCLNLTYNLYAGETDAQSDRQVSQLQSFLGVDQTGYFGPLTEQAVQSWQSSHGIVSSGSPDTTGYGFVGPQTRQAMGCGEATPYVINQPPQPTAFNPIAPGIVPPEMSRNTDFSMVDFAYYHDTISIFYVAHGMVYSLPGADLPTFEILTGSIFDDSTFAIDKNHAYYSGAIIPGANPQTFRVLNGGPYSTDGHTVYWQGQPIVGADPATFGAGTTATDPSAAKDKNSLYCGGHPYPLDSGQCKP